MTAGLLHQGQCLGEAAYLQALAGQSVGPGIVHTCSLVMGEASCSLLLTDGTTSSFSFTPPACADTTPITAEWFGYIAFAFMSAFMLRKTLKFFARFLGASDLA